MIQIKPDSLDKNYQHLAKWIKENLNFVHVNAALQIIRRSPDYSTKDSLIELLGACRDDLSITNQVKCEQCIADKEC